MPSHELISPPRRLSTPRHGRRRRRFSPRCCQLQALFASRFAFTPLQSLIAAMFPFAAAAFAAMPPLPPS
jgi:hypothetical protein